MSTFFLIDGATGRVIRRKEISPELVRHCNDALRRARQPERWCAPEDIPERVQPVDRHACPTCGSPTSRPGVCTPCLWDEPGGSPDEAA
jgi:hypothetical protein